MEAAAEEVTFAGRVKVAITDALKWWEPRRIIYNAMLGLVVVGYFVAYWPASRLAIDMDIALFIFVLAVIANLLYSVAYLPDLFIQFSAFREHRAAIRWLLFAVGLIFAAVLTRWFALGMAGAGQHTGHVLGAV